MSRNLVLQIAASIAAATVLGVILTGLSPLWLPVLLIKPAIIQPLSDLATHKVTRAVIRNAMSGGKRDATVDSRLQYGCRCNHRSDWVATLHRENSRCGNSTNRIPSSPYAPDRYGGGGIG